MRYRLRNNWFDQSAVLIFIAALLFGLVGFIGSMLDPSTEAERACITKPAQDFMRCVYDVRREHK